MMYYDLRETHCIELTECHHLAWVLGRLGALRPGSLGPPRNVSDNNQLPYLAWRDIRIQRTNSVGVFIVHLTIRNLKMNIIGSTVGERRKKSLQL